MNSVQLIGRLTADPQVRKTNGDTSVANYTLAVDRDRPAQDGKREADFIRCTAFAGNADFAGRNFHKGMRVGIQGRIQTGQYTNKDGQTVYTTDVIVSHQEFADSKQQGGNAPVAEAAPAPAPAAPVPDGDGFMDLPEGFGDDEGLPFN